MVGGAFLISASLVYGLDGYTPLMVAGAPLLAWVFGALAVLCFVYAWTDDS
jgi:ubiquinone biosynthesis protein